MVIEIGSILSSISVLIAVITLIVNQKKMSNDNGMNLGKFMGEIRAEIKSINEKIDELKSDHKEVDSKIKEAIIEHERIYHKDR